MGGLPPKPGLSHVSVLSLPSAKVCGFISLTHSLPVCHVPDTVHCPGDSGHSLHGPARPGPSLLQPLITRSSFSRPLPSLSSHATSGPLHVPFPCWVWLTPTQPLPPSCPYHPECPQFPPSPDSAPRLRGPGSGRPLGCAGLTQPTWVVCYSCARPQAAAAEWVPDSVLKISRDLDRKGQRPPSCSWEGLAEAVVEAHPRGVWGSMCWKGVGTELTAPEKGPG